MNWEQPISSAIGGLFSFGSALLGNRATKKENQKSRDFSERMYNQQVADNRLDATTAFERQKELLRNQQDYQSSREDTQYQRQVKDAIAAGLNPAVAGGQVAPSGVVSSSQVMGSHGGQPMMPPTADPGRHIADAGNNISRLISEASNLAKRGKQMDAETNYTRTMTEVDKFLKIAETANLDQATKNAMVDYILKNGEVGIQAATLENINALTKKLGAEFEEVISRTDLNKQNKEESIARSAYYGAQQLLAETQAQDTWLTLNSRLDLLASQSNLNKEQAITVKQQGIKAFMEAANTREILLQNKFIREHQDEVFNMKKLETFSRIMAEQINAGANATNAFAHAFDVTYNAEQERETRKGIAKEDRETRIRIAEMETFARNSGLFYDNPKFPRRGPKTSPRVPMLPPRAL